MLKAGAAVDNDGATELLWADLKPGEHSGKYLRAQIATEVVREIGSSFAATLSETLPQTQPTVPST